MSLTQRELDQFVRDETFNVAARAMQAEAERRYELVARAARERQRGLDATNGIIFSALMPIVDGMFMALGGALLVLAIFG